MSELCWTKYNEGCAMTAHSAKTILVAINNSEENQSLFKEALALASALRAKVVAVSVTPEYEGNTNRFFLRNAEEEFRKSLMKVLAEANEYATSLGLSMETVHRTGKPDEKICALAYEINADVILLGCAKRMQMERIMLGRTTAEVVANSPCDVLLLPEGAELRFDRILAGVNGSKSSEEAGLRTIDVAKSYGSEVHALYVTSVPTDRYLRYGVSREAEQKGWKVLKQYVSSASEQDVAVIAAIRGNIVEDCLTEYIKEKDIHLLIIGSQTHTFSLDMFFGSVLERIVSNTPCPVLVAKKQHDYSLSHS